MEKLRFRNKIEYASAAYGDAASYGFISAFLLFFLTTVAGVEPAFAGTITVVGALWNTLINPIVGYLSDHAMTRWGRRRPFMVIMSLPMAASTYMLFTAVDLLPQIKPLYYGAILLIFWTSYTGFFVHYLALGAEYTKDYNERTELRSYASIFNMLGNVVAMVMPSILVAFLTDRGLSTPGAWSATGAIVGITSMASIFITARAAKNTDQSAPCGERTGLPRPNLVKIFREYWQVLKLKPVKSLLFTSLFALVSYAMFTSDLVYYFTYNQGLSPEQVSGMFLYRTFACLVLILIMRKISAATDKRTALMWVFVIGAVSVTIARIIGVESMWQLYVFVFFVAVSTSVYWQLMPSIIYDVCEYDELENGKKRQGTIVSLQGLVEALATGMGSQILGIVLQLAGFDGSAQVQTETALTWVQNSVTVLPAGFLILAMIALSRYPITKERFEEIQRKLAERNKTE